MLEKHCKIIHLSLLVFLLGKFWPQIEEHKFLLQSLALSSTAHFHAHLHTLLWSNLTFKSNEVNLWTEPAHSWSCPCQRKSKKKRTVFQSLGLHDLFTSTEGLAKQSAPNDSYLCGIQIQRVARLQNVQNVCHSFQSCESNRDPVEPKWLVTFLGK